MKFVFYNLFFVLVSLSNYAKAQGYNDPIPAHDEFTIESQQLGETRNINVWTPPEYKTGRDALPVMYMLDGGIVDEDFPHVANTLAELIQAKKIPPVILVGIANTQRRRDLTGYTNVAKDKEIAPIVGGSEKFRAFIKEELFPEIDERYRTTVERSIIGESLAGLFVVETFLLTPDMFDNYIAFDPSLWWNDKYLVRSAKEHLSKFPPQDKKIWIAGSGTKGIPKNVKKFAEMLRAMNLANVKCKYVPEPKEEHGTIFRATKEKAFIWTLNKTE